MAGKTKCILVTIVLCFVLLAFASCGGSNNDNTTTTVAPHTHSYVEHTAISATCTTDGNNLYYTCSGCDEIFDSSKATITSVPTITATGHSYVEHKAVEPTCTTNGNDKYYTCDDCELIFDESKA